MKTILIMPVKYKSSRLKYKNILPIKNLPMFVYSMKKVNKSKKIDGFFVSTESQKIIDICKKYNINHIKRPVHLSKSNVEKQEVIVNALKILKKKKNKTRNSNFLPGQFSRNEITGFR